MSKILIGNNKEKVSLLKNHFEKYGFNQYSEFETSKCKIYAFKKLKVSNNNFATIGNDFVATSGTVIYNNKTGKPAMEMLYDDISKGINYIKENAVGNYCVAIKKDDCITIFTDKNAIYNIYYYNQNNDFLITNTFYHLAKTIDNLSINQTEILEYAFQYAILDNKTIFKDIYKLMGDEYLEIDLNIDALFFKKISLEKYQAKEEIPTPEQIAKKFAKETMTINSSFKKITIGTTGGLDSRIILAAFLNKGIKPQIIYGVGDSILTNTKNKDLEINKIYAEKFGLKLHEMNWKTNEPINEYWNYSLEKYGELFLVYAGNKNVFTEFETNVEADYITFGYYGELMRSFEWIDSIKKEYLTVNEFVNAYCDKNAINDILFDNDELDELKETILNKYIDICTSEGIDMQKIHRNQLTRLYFFYAKNASTVLCNLCNCYGYSSMIFFENDLLSDILNIPYGDKKNAKYMLSIMNILYPEILNVPIFSHGKEQLFNPKTLELSSAVNHHERLKIKLKKYLNHKKSLKILKKIYKIFKHNDEKTNLEIEQNNMLKNYFIHYLKSSNENNLKFDNYNFDVRPLAKYTQLIFMIEKLKDL
jgi:hypothetical protein